MSGFIVTANRLRDGRVVYFTSRPERWAEQIDASAWGRDAAAGEALLARAQADVAARVIVDPYVLEAQFGADGIQPLRLRERLRAAGPSVETRARSAG